MSLFLLKNVIPQFIYSEKATKFCEISTLLLSTVHIDKIKVEILHNFVAFSVYMNFKIALCNQISREIGLVIFGQFRTKTATMVIEHEHFRHWSDISHIGDRVPPWQIANIILNFVIVSLTHYHKENWIIFLIDLIRL